MQASQNTLLQSLRDINLQLQSSNTLTQSNSKQFILKLTSSVINNQHTHINLIRICFKTILEIQNKSYNLNSKIIPDIWKIFIKLQISIISPHQDQKIESQQSTINNITNLQDFYKFALSSQFHRNSQKLNLYTLDDLQLILKVWIKSFTFSDVKSFHYCLLSLQFCWILIENLQIENKQNLLKKIIIYLEKLFLNLIKYADRVKQSQSFESLLSLIQKIQIQFYTKYQKQIESGIKNLHQTFKLKSAINLTNTALCLWQKIILSLIILLSKRQNEVKDLMKIMDLLKIVSKTFCLEKLINFTLKGKGDILSSTIIISSAQLQNILFGVMLDLWINSQIIYQIAIQYANLEEQKSLQANLTIYKHQIQQFLKILTKRQLTVLMIRQIVKRLQITKLSYAVTQWKQLFLVMNFLLKSYSKNQTLIEFIQEKSHISKSFSPSLKFPFTVELKLKGQSIPFKQEKILIQFSDSQVKQKIWITMRNYSKNTMIFSFVKLLKNNIFGKEQKQFLWNQYEANKIQIVLKNNKIRLIVNNDQSKVLSIENSLGKVDQIVLCDRQSGMGSTISQLFSFKIIQYSIFQENEKKEIDLVPFIDSRYFNSSKDSMKENLKFLKCNKKYHHSFIYFMQSLGDLELFMLLLYHTLKKIKHEDELLQLIRMVLNLLEQFTICKQVQHKQLTQQEKNSRRNSVLCLSWFFAREIKSVFIIFELMRLLYIRGKRDNLQLLKFLCNFSYWKDFKLQKQTLIVMKIKQLMKQSTKQEEKLTNLVICKKILFDMVLYFKQSHYLMAEKQNCLKLHRIILETIYDHLKDIIEISNKKSKIYMLEIFSFMEFAINLVSCILNRKIHEQSFDITFAIEITLFLRDISKLLFVSKERKYITKIDIDNALESYFKKEEKQLILPLSLNAQQVCDQRFNLYLTKMMSISKSLIVLFDTQTCYFQQGQLKIYPINSQTPILCTETKVHSNIVNFEIYMSMLAQKSWNYILFGMPLSQYNERFCQSIWRICFYELFKQKKYYSKLCKMLQQTPLPQNEYCLMKIFQVVLFYSIFGKQYLCRILKSQNFTKAICPFKIQQLLMKYFNKLEPEVCNIDMQGTQYSIKNQKQKQGTPNYQQQKIYYVLLYSPNTDFDSCREIIDCLKYRRMYGKYKIILYQVILKSLVKYSQNKINQRKQKQQNYIQSSILPNQNKLKTNTLSLIQQKFYEQQDQFQSQCQNIKQRQLAQKQQFTFIDQKTYQQLIIYGIQALQYYQNSLTQNNMKKFFNIDSKQDIQALRQNFYINVQGMIKTLKSFKQLKSTHQFEKYLSFIDVYLQKYSMFLINTKFPQFKNQNIKDDQSVQENIKKGRNKFLYKTIHIDLIKISTQFFVQEINQRRSQLHNLQQIWNSVEKRNKILWNLFFSSNKYYSLSDITTQTGERLLLSISNQRPKIQLPKMINKHSMMCSVSLISDKFDPNDQSQLSTLFDECELLKTQLEEPQCKNKDKARKGSTSITKEIKTKKFRVLMIENDKIYQGNFNYKKGLLFMAQKDFIKFQQIYPNQKLYEKIGATSQQRRDDDEIQKDPKNIDILLKTESKIFFRKYLFFDAGIEIFSHEKTIFFCFDSDQKRNKFCSLYLKEHKIYTYQKIKKGISQESIKWSKGLISNYQYLMKVNQYANRSPNDLSQYYIMPWTIIEFEKKQIDKAYIFQFQNFRDLKKPLGKAFETKWKQIQHRFKMSFGKVKSMIDSGCGIQPFLYGSFYSNPAIVTNYMIRLEPFSSLHYILQSQKIDVADRLFFQFSDQFRSIKTNVSDIKELIPQFYNNPQFLKNRSRLNLGSRQNKEIVNDVRLPKWTDSAYEFTFKMKYFLECPLVTKFLNSWIDLIFGVTAKKQNALQADNLYMSEIYGPKETLEKDKKNQDKNRGSRQQFGQSKNSSILQLQNRILFNKQFGQLPMTIFDEKHPEFDMSDDYYFFKGTIQNLYSLSHSSKEHQIQFSIHHNYVVVSTCKKIQFLDSNSTDFNQKQNFKLISQIQLQNQISNSKLVSGQKLSSLLPYLFYVKKQNRRICSRYIKKAKLFGSLQLKEEFQILEGQIFNWICDQVFIVGHNNILKIYSFEECSINHCSGKIHLLKIQQTKPAISAKQFPNFTQHQAEILFIETNDDLKLIVSLDEMNKIFILKYYPDRIELINNFKIKNCHFEQKIIKLIIHKMSLIVCLTNYHRLLTFNFYGDIIGSKQIGFINQNKNQRQKINCISFFNKQTCEILFGTNFGNVWKIDLFEFYKTQDLISVKQLWFQKISLNSKDTQYDIKDLIVKRYGKHWQIYVISVDQSKKKFITKIKCLTMKHLNSNIIK